MKKVLSIILVFTICLTFCSCGKKSLYEEAIGLMDSEKYEEALSIFAELEDYEDSQNRMETCEKLIAITARFDDADKLASVLTEYYTGSDEDKKLIEANSSIHYFFQQDNDGIEMYHKLEDSLPLDQIFDIFDICNDTQWFYAIDTGFFPLCVQAGIHPTTSSIVNDIKDRFKDPQSVTIESACWAFIGENTDFFDTPLEYIMVATIRATNSFGGYVTEEYLIIGEITGSVKAVREYTFAGGSDIVYGSELYRAVPFYY